VRDQRRRDKPEERVPDDRPGARPDPALERAAEAGERGENGELESHPSRVAAFF
jgi:hypothetical protein